MIANERYWPKSRKESIVLGFCVCVFLYPKYENLWLQRAFVPTQASCRRNFSKLFTDHSPFPSSWVLKIQTTLKEIYKSRKIYLKRIRENMFYWDSIAQNYLVKINILPGTGYFFEVSCSLKRKKKKEKWWKDFLAFISHAHAFTSLLINYCSLKMTHIPLPHFETLWLVHIKFLELHEHSAH